MSLETIKSYQPELQEAVYSRLKVYGVSDVPADLYSSWMHVRALLSMHLKAETGEGLVKGNKPVTESQYNKCLKYLDMILPENKDIVKLR